MVLNIETGAKIAEFLLQIKAIKLDVDNPFVWSSGIKSPIYCDNRITLSYPQVRTFIRQQLVDVVTQAFGKPDVIAGVATGGIAHGVLVAQELGVPFVYVRSSVKEHGLQNQVEGIVETGQNVVVIEDLVSTGKSSINAVKALKATGCNVKGVVSIFSYGFEHAEEAFKQEGCEFYSLTNFPILSQKAVEKDYIIEKHIDTLNNWRLNPKSFN